MLRLITFVETISQLKIKQIFYRIYYFFTKPYPDFYSVTSRDWPLTWDIYVFDESATEDGKSYNFLGVQVADSVSSSVKLQEMLWQYNFHYNSSILCLAVQGKYKTARKIISQWISEYGNIDNAGWDPYCISKRLVNWIKFFRSSKEIRPSKNELNSMALQASILIQRLEHHLLANHLWANGKALVFFGAFAEGEFADKCLRQGLRILREELEEQFLPDGAHFELSPMYHADLMWDIIDLYQLTKITKIKSLQNLKPILEAKLCNGLHWIKSMSHPDGGISFFNDAAFGIAPNFGQLMNYTSKVIGKDFCKIVHQQPAELSTVWSLEKNLKCGYHVASKSINELPAKIIIDMAEVGPKYQPGHGHADTLSFELSLFGRRVFVNSGTSTYKKGRLRSWQRSTQAHNTVVIEEKNSSNVWSSFRIGKRAKVVNTYTKLSSTGIEIEGIHNGYNTLLFKKLHQRKYHLNNSNIVITDKILGNFSEASAYFYLHPECELENNSGLIKILAKNRLLLTMQFTGEDRISILGTKWFPKFGVSKPNLCIMVSFKNPSLITKIEINEPCEF